MKTKEEKKLGAVFFITGGLLGAGIALLFAPQSGKKTRHDIGRAMDGLQDSGNWLLHPVLPPLQLIRKIVNRSCCSDAFVMPNYPVRTWSWVREPSLYTTGVTDRFSPLRGDAE